MTRPGLEQGFEMARGVAERVFGHAVSPFDTYGQGACAECVRPGCNMGLTIQYDPAEEYEYLVLGSAVVFHCASAERPLRDPLSLLYSSHPLEGK